MYEGLGRGRHLARFGARIRRSSCDCNEITGATLLSDAAPYSNFVSGRILVVVLPRIRCDSYRRVSKVWTEGTGGCLTIIGSDGRRGMRGPKISEPL
jgi:hypothetical protein